MTGVAGLVVRAPGSSANLGPGFDALGLAVALAAEVGTAGSVPGPGAQVAHETHPAMVAFRAAGGSGALWVRSRLPMGRGLGYSGAVRVAGATAGVLQEMAEPRIDDSVRRTVLDVAAALEGHADNAAASIHGGLIATAGGRVVQVPLGFEPVVVVWIPEVTTSTDSSRRNLATEVSFADAVFNVGRVAVLVAALAAGDVGALRTGTEDRLHQPVRFGRASHSWEARRCALDAGAWCAWLSGSGPTVAALCSPDDAAAIAGALPGDGVARVVDIDHTGVALVP